MYIYIYIYIYKTQVLKTQLYDTILRLFSEINYKTREQNKLKLS